MIYAAVLGCGNIGSGVVQVIEENQEQIRRAVPEGIEVKYILDLRDFPGAPFEHKVVHDLDVILNDPDISVICETMGGKEPAYTFSRKALERGISVCSSNKELVEAYGPALLKTAAEHNCSYMFEASVGGGIPLLTPLLTCLMQEEIDSIEGILNGTTNYILTKMEHEGAEYDAVLKEAQELGYAERNPAADVEGHDTGRKIAILASLMSGKTVRYEDETVEGITGITPADFVYASAAGYTIKLLGIARKKDGRLYVMTAPFMLPESHPLYSVNGVFNGVLVHGNMVDNLMFYGRGAGKLPTASAVVSDMINAVKCSPGTFPVRWDSEVLDIDPADENENSFFVRFEAGKEEDARKAYGECILDVLKGEEQEFAFITQPLKEKCFREKAATAGGAISWIRVMSR